MQLLIISKDENKAMEVEKIYVKSDNNDFCIMKNHCDLLHTISSGSVIIDDKINITIDVGFISIENGICKLIY